VGMGGWVYLKATTKWIASPEKEKTQTKILK
jgi:hypothetical protein